MRSNNGYLKSLTAPRLAVAMRPSIVIEIVSRVHKRTRNREFNQHPSFTYIIAARGSHICVRHRRQATAKNRQTSSTVAMVYSLRVISIAPYLHPSRQKQQNTDLMSIQNRLGNVARNKPRAGLVKGTDRGLTANSTSSPIAHLFVFD